jgi:type VI secretion system lysozyme-like protein
VNVQLGFLDRLVRRRHDLRHKDNEDCVDTLSLLQKNLMNDLVWLLNTRQLDWERLESIPAGLDEVQRSLFLYGLPDFSAQTKPKEIENTIVKTIRLFEPRLRVSVQHLPGKDSKSISSMSFRVTAKIELNSGPVAFVYEPVIEVENGHSRIRKDL